ncbi:MAG: sugar phosphate isomerase/epimerase family protein [Bacillota bacterium]|jgi:sugar phosphate isomerase/epimerase|nr:sugar phosphate isomerase/epimerase family protein [Bacillota bacterium]
MINNKLALSTADIAPDTAPIVLVGSPEENLETAFNLGYDAIEIHMRENELIDAPKIKEKMKERDISISTIVTGRLNTEGGCSLLAEEPYIVDAAIEGLQQYVDLASKFNTDLIIGWVKGNVPSRQSRNKYMKRLAKNLSLIDQAAGEKDVKLFIEVINRYETNIFNTCKELVYFLDEYNLENSYVHLDTFHMNIEENNMTDAIRLAGERLGYIHFADNDRNYPGHGCIDFVNVVEVLKEISYSGYISVECLPFPDRETAAKKSIEFLKNL